MRVKLLVRGSFLNTQQGSGVDLLKAKRTIREHLRTDFDMIVTSDRFETIRVGREFPRSALIRFVMDSVRSVVEIEDGRRGFIPGRKILEGVIFVIINNRFDIFNFTKY
jgi:hypothetical protein